MSVGTDLASSPSRRSFMSSSLVRLRTLAVAGGVAVALAVAACSSGGSRGGGDNNAGARGSGGNNNSTGTVTVAVVSNPLITSQMVPLTQSVFEKQNPGIKLKFATYTE